MNDTPRETLFFYQGPEENHRTPLETLMWQIGGDVEDPLELADKGRTLVVRDVRKERRNKVIKFMERHGLRLY